MRAPLHPRLERFACTRLAPHLGADAREAVVLPAAPQPAPGWTWISFVEGDAWTASPLYPHDRDGSRGGAVISGNGDH